MSSELHDLLCKMLWIEPNLRISAKEALEHPYFATEPLPCSQVELKVDADESHEYLERMKKKLASGDFEKQSKEEETKVH